MEDYKDDPDAYELEQRSRPDEMAMINRAKELASDILATRKSAQLLDLCCGTGMSIDSLLDNPNVSLAVGLDCSPQYLKYGFDRLRSKLIKPIFILGDAVDTPLPPLRWDLIVLASAYHHIDDPRKQAFLKRVRSLLDPDGVAVIAENILPEYQEGNRDQYKSAVQLFYERVLEQAVTKNPSLSPKVASLIRRVAQYGFDGEYEYKVCYSIMKRDFERSGLTIIHEERVWPETGCVGEMGGNYVMIATP